MITEDDLTQIVEDICQSLFAGGGEVPPDRPPAEEPVRHLTAVIDISGDWNGSVSVSCERETAVLIASVMFDAPGPELSRNDVIDALGEFANMAGGAVKGMLEGEKGLGLPTVAEGTDYVMVVPHTSTVADISYGLVTGDTVRVSVHEVAA